MAATTVLAVLDARGRVSLINSDSGAELAGTSTGDGVYSTVGGVLSVDPERRLLLVLTPFVSYDKPQRVVALSTDGLTERFTTDLPSGEGQIFRATVLGADTILVVGNIYGNSVVVAEVKLDGGAVVHESRMTPSESPHDWRVLAASLSGDERQLFVSYHGAGTTGTDVFTRKEASWVSTCPVEASERREGAGCIPNHGMVVQVDGSVVAATGSQYLDVYDAEWERRDVDSGLAGNHLMRFALAPGAHFAVAVGSCSYRPGLAVLRGAEIEPELIDSNTCGELAAVSAKGMLAIAKNARVYPSPVRAGSVVFRPLYGAEIPRQVTLSAEVADLVWIR